MHWPLPRAARVAALLFLGIQAARATSLIPTGVETLAAGADFSVRAVVERVDTRAAERAPRAGKPVTEVRLRTLEALSGVAPRSFTLRMLGGDLGAKRLVVHGSPWFAPGEEVVLFVQGNGRAASPVMAFGYGVFRVERPAGAPAFVRRDDGTAVSSLADTALPLAGCGGCQRGEEPHRHPARAITSPPMALESFTAGIQSLATRQGRAPQLER
jgi:hypothetical protein